MHSTDLQVLANLAPVAKQLLEKGGFTVDMQSMDWQTLVSRRAKKEPPSEGGWNAFLTSWVGGRRAQPDQHRRAQRVLRQGLVRLAVRRAARTAARRLRARRPILPSRPSSPIRSRRARSRSAPTPMSASGTADGLPRQSSSGVVHGPAPFFWNVDQERVAAAAADATPGRHQHARLRRPPPARHHPGTRHGGDLRLPDAAPDAGRSGRDHRRRQRHRRSRSPRSATSSASTSRSSSSS